jgi:hypothetical protein
MFDDIIQSAVESLLDDEALTSEMTDDEASAAIKWATWQLKERVAQQTDEAAAQKVAQAEVARLRRALRALNRDEAVLEVLSPMEWTLVRCLRRALKKIGESSRDSEDLGWLPTRPDQEQGGSDLG